MTVRAMTEFLSHIFNTNLLVIFRRGVFFNIAHEMTMRCQTKEPNWFWAVGIVFRIMNAKTFSSRAVIILKDIKMHWTAAARRVVPRLLQNSARWGNARKSSAQNAYVDGARAAWGRHSFMTAHPHPVLSLLTFVVVPILEKLLTEEFEAWIKVILPFHEWC